MNRYKIFLIACLLMSIILTACGTTPQTIEVTKIIPQTVIVTQLVPETVVVTQIVMVTPTPEPPTSTPEPSPTPDFQRWTSSDVVESFTSTAVEVGSVSPLTKEDYGMAPMRAVEGSHFLIPSLCETCGGRIFSFSTQEDLDITKAYYEELGKNSAMFFSWLFVKDNILVQINGQLSEEKALQYEAALMSLE